MLAAQKEAGDCLAAQSNNLRTVRSMVLSLSHEKPVELRHMVRGFVVHSTGDCTCLHKETGLAVRRKISKLGCESPRFILPTHSLLVFTRDEATPEDEQGPHSRQACCEARRINDCHAPSTCSFGFFNVTLFPSIVSKSRATSALIASHQSKRDGKRDKCCSISNPTGDRS